MRQRRAVLTLATTWLCLGFSIPAAADQPANTSRAAWEWTDAERLNERVNPEKAQVRVREFRAVRGRTMEKASTGIEPGDVIDGRSHPELFMPIELFRILINGAFAADPEGRAIYRSAREASSTVPLSDEFWIRLGVVAERYVAVWRQIQSINEEAGKASGAERSILDRKSQVLSGELCGVLAASLTGARREFGRDAFDRFLYESVAPNVVITTAAPNTQEELSFMTRGCK